MRVEGRGGEGGKVRGREGGRKGGRKGGEGEEDGGGKEGRGCIYIKHTFSIYSLSI